MTSSQATRGCRARGSTGHRSRWIGGLLVLLGIGCGGNTTNAPADSGDLVRPDAAQESPGPKDAGTADAETSDAKTSDSAAGADAVVSGILTLPTCAVANKGSCVKPLDRTASDVCARYLATTVDPTVNVFKADPDTCSPGQTEPTAIGAALQRINFYRWLVGVSDVTLSASESTVATACAAITAHRPDVGLGQIVDLHHPPTTTPCYTAAGADAAATSLVGPGVDQPAVGIDALMYDYGEPNRGILGHRLLVLDPVATELGIGYSRNATTGLGAECVKLPPLRNFGPMSPLDGMSMYPSPGAFPWDALVLTNVEEPLSWTFVLPAVLGLQDAKVSMFVESPSGPTPIEITSGPAGGSPREATLWFTPQSTPLRGATVVVEITNLPVGPIGYRVVLADCGTVPVNPQETEQGGPCSITYQDCVTPGYTCAIVPGGSTFNGECVRAGSFPAGTPCYYNRSCVAGTGCVPGPPEDSVCSTFCDFGADAVRPCDSVCKGNGYSELWMAVDKDGNSFGEAICKS